MLFNPRYQNKSGSILIAGVIILGVMVFSATYLLSFTITGSKMSNSYELSAKTYYLAEAGISEAIFKLKNDPVWKNAFETNPTALDPFCSGWSIAPYTRSSALGLSNSYEITIANLGCAKAEIASLAKINAGEAVVAQKIVKVKVFKAMGNIISDFVVFTGGASENLDISGVNPFNIYGGNLFSNNILKAQNFSVVRVDDDKKALASGNLLISGGSQVIATSCAKNLCELGCNQPTECPPDNIEMPSLNFDEGEGSYLTLAQNSDCSSVRQDGKTNCVFTTAEFELAMWRHYPLFSLPAGTTIYVTGDINVRAGQQLVVNGTLLSGRDINLGQDFCWTFSQFPFVRCGRSKVTVIRPGLPADNLPSGILAERKINTGGWLGFGSEALDINGLVYAGDEAKFASVGGSITIRGAVAARKFSLSSLWGGVDFYLDSDVIVDTFKDPQYSPTITIDHWEEKY